MKAKRIFSLFHKDRRGVTSIEYALLAGGLAIAIIAGVSNLGGSLKSSFDKVANGVSSAPSSGSAGGLGGGGSSTGSSGDGKKGTAGAGGGAGGGDDNKKKKKKKKRGKKPKG